MLKDAIAKDLEQVDRVVNLQKERTRRRQTELNTEAVSEFSQSLLSPKKHTGGLSGPRIET